MPKSQRPLVDTLALSAVMIYRNTLSHKMLPSCRLFPSCSAYAFEALERYGAFRGGWLAVRRVLRCHPLARAGFDPLQ